VSRPVGDGTGVAKAARQHGGTAVGRLEGAGRAVRRWEYDGLGTEGGEPNGGEAVPAWVVVGLVARTEGGGELGCAGIAEAVGCTALPAAHAASTAVEKRRTSTTMHSPGPIAAAAVGPQSKRTS
jgi:hypothetical protein